MFVNVKVKLPAGRTCRNCRFRIEELCQSRCMLFDTPIEEEWHGNQRMVYVKTSKCKKLCNNAAQIAKLGGVGA